MGQQLWALFDVFKVIDEEHQQKCAQIDAEINLAANSVQHESAQIDRIIALHKDDRLTIFFVI